MPRPVNQRQPLDVSAHAVGLLIIQAAKAPSAHEARDYANAALTVAQAICQQQMNQPKRNKRK